MKPYYQLLFMTVRSNMASCLKRILLMIFGRTSTRPQHAGTGPGRLHVRVITSGELGAGPFGFIGMPMNSQSVQYPWAFNSIIFVIIVMINVMAVCPVSTEVVFDQTILNRQQINGTTREQGRR